VEANRPDPARVAVINGCPGCQKLFETTTENAYSPNRSDQLCPSCYVIEFPPGRPKAETSLPALKVSRLSLEHTRRPGAAFGDRKGVNNEAGSAVATMADSERCSP
jgi:hypothetical protein